eukprot:1877320-Amphidinium_carterae.1
MYENTYVFSSVLTPFISLAMFRSLLGAVEIAGFSFLIRILLASMNEFALVGSVVVPRGNSVDSQHSRSSLHSSCDAQRVLIVPRVKSNKKQNGQNELRNDFVIIPPSKCTGRHFWTNVVSKR